MFIVKLSVRASDFKVPDEIGLYGVLLAGGNRKRALYSAFSRARVQRMVQPRVRIHSAGWLAVGFLTRRHVGIPPPEREIHNRKAGEPVIRPVAIEFDSVEVND